MEPTIEQLKAFYDLCVRVSNLLQTIELTRYDKRSHEIKMPKLSAGVSSVT
jgi:hypothetical protein